MSHPVECSLFNCLKAHSLRSFLLPPSILFLAASVAVLPPKMLSLSSGLIVVCVCASASLYHPIFLFLPHAIYPCLCAHLSLRLSVSVSLSVSPSRFTSMCSCVCPSRSGALSYIVVPMCLCVAASLPHLACAIALHACCHAALFGARAVAAATGYVRRQLQIAHGTRDGLFKGNLHTVQLRVDAERTRRGGARG